MALAWRGAQFTAVSATTTVVAIANADKTSKVRLTTLRIDDFLNDATNTASFTAVGYVPTVGMDVKIGIGGIAPANRIFGGTIVAVTQVYEGVQGNVAYQVTCNDYTYLMRRRYPIGTYAGQSATAIAKDLILRYASSLFSAGNVAAGLSPVTITFDGTRDLAACLTALATLAGCYWYPDANRDVHFFVTEATGNPTTIDATNIAPTNPTGARALAATTEITQARTRVYVRYKETSAAFAATVGATTLTVASAAQMASSGNVMVGPQRITYSAIGSAYGTPSAWTAQTPASTHTWSAVCWSDALAIFVAVGTNGVMTSPDGVTWTDRTPASVAAWHGVVWSPTLTLFAAVATTGPIMTSPDGINWTLQTPPAVGDGWQRIVWADTLTLFVAVGIGGTTYRVMTSPDGVNWTGRTTGVTADNWKWVVWADSLGLLVAANDSSATNAIMTSPDGINWTSRAVAMTGGGIALMWSTSHILTFVYGPNSATSTNGTVWTVHASVLTGSGAVVSGVWTDSAGFTVLQSSGQSVYTSLDGVTWTIGTDTVVSSWVGLCWSASRGEAVAVGTTGGGVATVMTNIAAIYATLTGIPASGAGSIVTAIAVGDSVVPEVQRDDVAAQAVLAALEGGDGVHEYVITDTSITTSAGAITRGDAELALFKSPLTEITYATRDILTRSGKTVTVSLGAPTSITASLQIQQATWTQFEAQGTYPLITVKAAQTKFTLQDLLRRVTLAA